VTKWVPAVAVIPTPQVLMLITGREAGVGGYKIWITIGTHWIYVLIRNTYNKLKPLAGVTAERKVYGAERSNFWKLM